MLGKAVCGKCCGGADLGMVSGGGFSLEEIATFIRNLGTLDAVADAVAETS